MSVYLETNVQPEWPCAKCKGGGVLFWQGPGGAPDNDWCSECGGGGVVTLGSEFATLAHNLAIAGALCDAFNRGGTDSQHYPYWAPNADGKPAP